MTLELYAFPVDETIETAFPELSKAAPGIIWILPEGLSWEEPRRAKYTDRVSGFALRGLVCLGRRCSQTGDQKPPSGFWELFGVS